MTREEMIEALTNQLWKADNADLARVAMLLGWDWSELKPFVDEVLSED